MYFIYVGREIYIFFKYCKTNFNFFLYHDNFILKKKSFTIGKKKNVALGWVWFVIVACEPSLNGENDEIYVHMITTYIVYVQIEREIQITIKIASKSINEI